MFDVLSVRLISRRVGLIAQKKSEGEAHVVMGRMIARRGLDDEFFAVVPTGTYRDNDPWKGPEPNTNSKVTENAPTFFKWPRWAAGK